MSSSTPTTTNTSTSNPTPSDSPINPTTAPSTYNGEDQDQNGDAESSKMAEQTLSQPMVHALQMTDYVFNVGYLQQRWADVQLTFFSDAIKLHRIILARSPFLAQCLFDAGPGTTTHISFRDEAITSESVHTCIHHLYSPAFHRITPSNARAVLATSLHFGGMPELVHQAYTVCRESISPETISDWVNWASGTVVPPHQYAQGTGEEAWEEGEGRWFGRYGEYSDLLRSDISDFLINTLPHLTPDSDTPPTTPLAHLLPYYASLPFPLFKRVLESNLPFEGVQAKFGFAKKAIGLRKKKAASMGMEEAAVLAFKGEEGGGGVEITRKNKKGRPTYWKVEP